MPGYTNIPKPTGDSYSKVNIGGQVNYDDSLVLYDDPSVFYDGYNAAAYTNISKPVSSVYTKIAKPT